jgi:hypothetical protein
VKAQLANFRKRINGETIFEIISEYFAEFFRIDQKYDPWIQNIRSSKHNK